MALPADGARRTSWREIAAIALVAVGAATQVPDGAWNGAAHFALVQSLADGTPRIDEHLNQSGDIAFVEGHFYAAKAPGLALVSLPAYAIASVLGQIPTGSPTSPPPGAHYAAGRTMWYVNLVVVLAYLVLLLAIRWAANEVVPGAGTPVALMLGIATLLLPFASSYFAHEVSAALGFASFAAVLYERRRSSSFVLVAAGVLAGTAIVVEFPAVIVSFAVALYVLADTPHLARLGLFVAGLLAGITPLLAFNTWAFGSPFRTPYAHAVKELGASGHDVVGANDEGIFGLTRPDLGALADILVSEKGLFVLTPITVVALAGLPGLARRGWRREAYLVGGLTIAMLLYNASYYLPFGGNTPGPRFLVLLLPFLALPLADAWTRWRVTTLVVASVSAFWMVAATVAGPLIPTDEHPTVWLSRIAENHALSGSVVVGGWGGAAMLIVPVVGGVALASSPVIARFARGDARLHAGRSS